MLLDREIVKGPLGFFFVFGEDPWLGFRHFRHGQHSNVLRWSPTGQAVVPMSRYPPTPLGAEALRCAGAKASEGCPPLAKSAEAMSFITCRVQRRDTRSSTGKARGLLRRRTKNPCPLGMKRAGESYRSINTPAEEMSWEVLSSASRPQPLQW